MPEELAGFEQCFLTGTAAEVTPVSEIGPYRFAVGEIAKTLMDDYSRRRCSRSSRRSRRTADAWQRTKPPVVRPGGFRSNFAAASAPCAGRQFSLPLGDRPPSAPCPACRARFRRRSAFRRTAPDAGTLDRGDMDEHVLAAVVRSNESIALRRIEEFHGAVLTHRVTFFVRFPCPRRAPRSRGSAAFQMSAKGWFASLSVVRRHVSSPAALPGAPRARGAFVQSSSGPIVCPYR